MGTNRRWYAMSIVSTESARFDAMERVADLTFKGWSATDISKETGIARKEVVTLQEDYRAALSEDQQARDMARDHLNMMVKHYDGLIKRFYDLVDEIDQLPWNAAAAAQKNSALKAIAELDAKRVDALAKAGLLDSAELGDELADMEEKQAILIDILRNDLCPDCQAHIAHKLTKVTGQVEVVADYDVEVVDNG